MNVKNQKQVFCFVCGSVVGLVLIYVVVTNPGYDRIRTIHGKILFSADSPQSAVYISKSKKETRMQKAIIYFILFYLFIYFFFFSTHYNIFHFLQFGWYISKNSLRNKNFGTIHNITDMIKLVNTDSISMTKLE